MYLHESDQKGRIYFVNSEKKEAGEFRHFSEHSGANRSSAARETARPTIGMTSVAMHQHAHTVHGATHFADRWLKSPLRTLTGSSVHGGKGGYFKASFMVPAPQQAVTLDDLDDEHSFLWQILAKQISV